MLSGKLKTALKLFRREINVQVLVPWQAQANAAKSLSTSSADLRKKLSVAEIQKLKNEVVLQDADEFADTFGNISRLETQYDNVEDDPEDIKEYKRHKAARRMSPYGYIEEIRGHLNKNDYKKALRILEVDMVNDSSSAIPYVYKMFLSHLGKSGDLKEAYRLYTKYKKENGIITGGMYTSLFNACANCTNSFLALEKAEAIREYMMNSKHHTPNLANYNAMLKAYGRHGDLQTCLKIVDEVLVKKDKVRNETYNFLIQACISDTNSGLRHAIIVWRKMLQYRQAPTIYTFNLMLRCIRDCFFGEVDLINDLIKQIERESGKFYRKKVKFITKNNEKMRKIIKIPVSAEEAAATLLVKDKEIKTNADIQITSGTNIETPAISDIGTPTTSDIETATHTNSETSTVSDIGTPTISDIETATHTNSETPSISDIGTVTHTNIGTPTDNLENLEDKVEIINSEGEYPILEDNGMEVELPNLLTLTPTVGAVISFGSMMKPWERFLCFGGVKGFLQVMSDFGVNPSIKTLTLMLSVVPETIKAEEEIMEEIKKHNLKIDVGFINILLMRRLRRIDSSCLEDCLKEFQKAEVVPDIITFGILTSVCTTHERGIQLIETARKFGIRLNSQILGGLLRQADVVGDLNYVKTILQAAKEDDASLKPSFIALLGKIVRRERNRRSNGDEIEEISSNFRNLDRRW